MLVDNGSKLWAATEAAGPMVEEVMCHPTFVCKCCLKITPSALFGVIAKVCWLDKNQCFFSCYRKNDKQSGVQSCYPYIMHDLWAAHVTTTMIWLHAAYEYHRPAGAKCLPTCDWSLAEIGSLFRCNCMKWKAVELQVHRISVARLKGKEECSEWSWSPWVYEACSCCTECV